MNTVTLDTKITISEDVYFQNVSSEAVILDTKSGLYFGLDPVGTRMWELLKEHAALQPAYRALLDEYDVTPEKLETDLLSLVNKFIEKGLMQVREE